MDKILDNLEFGVSQDVDGVLSDSDRRVLGERLVGNAAREWADADRRMNGLLRSHDPLPEIDFDAFFAGVSAAIADEPAHVAKPLRLPGAWWRGLSIAAGLALAATLGAHFWSDRRPAAAPSEPAGMALVNVSTTAPSGSITIAVGPTEQLKQQGLALGLGTTPVASGKPRVVITSVDLPVDLRPY